MHIRNILGFIVGVVVFYILAAFTHNDISWVASLYNDEGSDALERFVAMIFVAAFGGVSFAAAGLD